MKALRELRATFKDRPAPLRNTSSQANGAKHVGSLQPPKMVIRAISDYKSNSPYELSFCKGDFFHIISDENAVTGWLEACNPMTNARGFVPASFFDVLHRTSPNASFHLHTHSELNPHGTRLTPVDTQEKSMRTIGAVFAKAKYEFKAELPHELNVKEGDGLIIVARSNIEWLVAKPIDRISSPGLIPTTFVEFRDCVSGLHLSITESNDVLTKIPSVFEWKEQNKRFYDSAIPLGTFEVPIDRTKNNPLPPLPMDERNSAQTCYESVMFSAASKSVPGPSVRQPSFSNPHVSGTTMDSSTSQSMHFLPLGIMNSSCVDGVHFEPNDYWFRLRVTYTSALLTSDHGDTLGYEIRDLKLHRLYEDFIEFDRALKQEFGFERNFASILPALPVSRSKIDDSMAQSFRIELDQYMQKIAAMPEFILRSSVIRAFLELRPGDRCYTKVTSQLPEALQYPPFQYEHMLLMHEPFSGDNSSTMMPPLTRSTTMQTTPSSSTGTSDTSTYYRVKVMRRRDNEMIALRLAPGFSYSTLLSKIQERFGTDIRALDKTPVRGGSGILNDNDLHAWIQESLAEGKKLLLYADV